MTNLIDLSRMIRPWWRGSELNGDHIYRDCERLEEEGEPREGVGWLDPYGTDVCGACFERHDPEESWKRENDDC